MDEMRSRLEKKPSWRGMDAVGLLQKLKVAVEAAAAVTAVGVV
jgi:hypothetical protein